MIARFLSLMLMLLLAPLARAQTLQLPSFHSFGIDTTVVVPDSGPAALARDRRANYGVSNFGGLPRNRGWGISLNAGGGGATAQIHDPRTAEPTAAANERRTSAIEGPRNLQSAAGQAAIDPPLAGVAELARRRAEQSQAQGADVAALIEKARQAKAAGKDSVAAIYYRAAAAQATGELKRQIDVERSTAAQGSKTPCGSQ